MCLFAISFALRCRRLPMLDGLRRDRLAVSGATLDEFLIERAAAIEIMNSSAIRLRRALSIYLTQLRVQRYPSSENLAPVERSLSDAAGEWLT